MARRKRGLIRKSSSSAPIWQRAVVWVATEQWARLTLLSAILVLLVYWQREMLLYQVQRIGGYGTIPVAIWLVLAMATLQLRPRWLLQWWRWWLATALLVAALLTALGGVHGATGALAKFTLGGLMGQTLWGGTPFQGVPLIAVLVALAATAFWPRHAYRIAWALLRALGIAAMVSLRRLGRWTWQSMRAAAFALVGKAQHREETRPELLAAAGSSDEPLSGKPVLPEQKATQGKAGAREPGSTGLGQAAAGVAAASNEANVQRAQMAQLSVLKWKMPAISLLENGRSTTVTEAETAHVAKKIEETMSTHGVQVTVDQIKPGPTVTLYGLTPGWKRKTKDVKQRDRQGNVLLNGQGRPVITRKEEQTRVKVDSIVAREKDLALALAAPSLRIQAPVPGESVVGIEVPNRSPTLVTIRSVMETATFRDIVAKGGLPLALGQGSGGDPVATDLRELPHLLIAGATGSGKSVCINALIVSLTSQVSPEKMRLLLIDPKRVELTPFNGLPHLAVPVVVDTEPAVRTLKGMLREMLRRFRRLEELGVRNIEGYHNHPQALEPMPYLVIAVDEMADLMMAAPYDIEQTLCRLAQLGRATGIHLIVATQRPSVDVVTGLIKANFPSRISFAVVSQVDSRTILDSGGGERLLGKGDMLFLSHETPKPQRVQGAYVSDREIGRLMEFWRSQSGPPLPQFDLDPEPQESQEDSLDEGEPSSPQDELMDKAIELATRYSHLSTSLLQRRLRIGYPRAARLMDQLEDAGIIEPGEPGKSREVVRRSNPSEAGQPPQPPPV